MKNTEAHNEFAMDSPLKAFEEHRLIAVIRSGSPEDAEAMIKAAIAGGFRILEISLQTPHATRIIETFSKKDSLLIGAGNVADGEMAMRAIKAGAKYLANQYTDRDVINVAKNNDAFVIQGAATPTEAFNAYQFGADLVRIYPAGFSGGPNFVKVLRNHLPFVKFVAQGDVTLDNFADYLKHCVAVSVGKALYDKSLIRQDNWAEVGERAKQFTQKLEALKVTK
jgi:2-dehydro-3-deoxyphosphogluconate aldolase/(4S)-4-hydroxy-2-oxoglutarate aldolase